MLNIYKIKELTNNNKDESPQAVDYATAAETCSCKCLITKLDEMVTLFVAFKTIFDYFTSVGLRWNDLGTELTVTWEKYSGTCDL